MRSTALKSMLELTPQDARLPSKPNETRPVDWSKLDNILRGLERGEVKRLAKGLGISLTTLHRRRRKLGLVKERLCR